VIPDADLLAGDDITLIHASLDDSVAKAREVAGMLN
jgi:hypothetical protein